jgi:hypothetical protein
MKRIASLILAVFALYGQLSAQSVLRVRLADNTRFNVSVNGRYFDRKGTSITVGDLPAGNHYVKIFKVSYDRWGRVFDRTIFQGTVRTRNGMVSQMVYDPYARRMGVNLIPDNTIPVIRPDYNNDQNRAKYNDVPEPSRMANQDRPVSAYEPEPAQAVTERNNPPSNLPPASPLAEGSMTDNDVEALKIKVDGQKTDTEKLKLLKSELRKETITTFQLATMLDWLLFESTKVELAKWAYYITKDKDYFSDIFNKFSYQSSKDELKQFVDNKN